MRSRCSVLGGRDPRSTGLSGVVVALRNRIVFLAHLLGCASISNGGKSLCDGLGVPPYLQGRTYACKVFGVKFGLHGFPEFVPSAEEGLPKFSQPARSKVLLIHCVWENVRQQFRKDV